eukprot:m.185702 g.185702  ORF g.185702 m.185702 type:complete len:1003 (+) comp18122_c2_seq11:419-3427(+)
MAEAGAGLVGSEARGSPTMAAGQGEICRVCRAEGAPDHPLFYPCLCTGSIRYIHQDCLLEWLKHSRKRYCELCNHPFSFQPVYAENTPVQLPVLDLVVGLLRTSASTFSTWSRVLLVAVCWGFLLPIVARWTWALYFDEWAVPWQHPDPLRHLVWSWIEGTGVGAVIFCSVLGVLGLRDFIVANELPFADPLAELDDVDVDVDVDFVGQPIGGLGGVGQAQAADDGDGQLDEMDDGFSDGDEPADQDLAVLYGHGYDDYADAEQEAHQHPEAAANHRAQADNQAGELDAVLDGAAAAAAPGAPAWAGGHDEDGDDGDSDWEDTDTEMDTDTEGVDDDVDDGDDGDDRDNVPIVAAAGADVADDEDLRQAMGVPADDVLVREVPIEELIGLVGPVHQLFDNLLWVVVLNCAIVGLFAFVPWKLGQLCFYLVSIDVDSVVVPVAVGYAVCGAAMLLRQLIIPAHQAHQTALGRFLSFFTLFVKVCVLLTCEVVLCPILTGWWIDICTLELQQATLKQQQAFFAEAPGTSTFLHWLLGMLAMHNCASFVALLRDIFRPGVLWFFRDPSDPDFHPIKQMLELSLASYSRRLVAVIVLYGVLVVGLIWLPVKTCIAAAPSLLPFNIILAHPVELLSFNLVIPLIQENMDPAQQIKDSVSWWITMASSRLGLAGYMLTDPAADEVNGPAAGGDDVDRAGPAEDNGNADGAAGAAPRAFTPASEIPWFAARLAVFIAVGWLSMYVIITGLLAAPVLIGRWLISLMTNVVVHELYTFLMGLLALSTFYKTADALRSIQQRRLSEVAGTTVYRLRSLAVPFAKVLIVLVTTGLVLPLQVGLLLEMVVFTPLTVPSHMSPVPCLWQCWAVGLIIVKLAHQFAVTGPPERWNRLLHQVTENGLRNLNLPLFLQVTLPLVSALGIILSVPYVFAHGIVKKLGLLDAQGRSILFRQIYPGALLLFAAVASIQLLRGAILRLCKRVRDSKYLIGERLLNYEPRRATDPPAQTATDS